MPKHEQQDNSGSLFINDRKVEDRHPDRSGHARIDGVEYWVSGWLKKTKDGQPWLSLSFRKKDGPAKEGAESGGAPVEAEDIPF